MKRQLKYDLENTLNVRKSIFANYLTKYFNVWLNSYEWRGISYDAQEFIMRRLWDTGSVAAFAIIKPDKKAEGTKPEFFNDGLCGFTTFAVTGYNMYSYPAMLQLVNLRGTPYVPSKAQIVNKDAVICYAQHSKTPIFEIVKQYVEKITNVEMCIRTNLVALQLPVLIENTAENQQHAQELYNHIVNADPIFFVDAEELESYKNLGVNPQYNIDKLYSYKNHLENELLTFLGINNVNIEKNEHLITDEVNANNEIINVFGDSVESNLKVFCENINKILGFNISVKRRAVKENQEIEEGENENE